jgi:3-deoxy-D-manno-octulosonic acid kinase
MLPDGLHAVQAEGAVAFAAPEVEAWVHAVLGRGARLYEAAKQEAEALFQGRGPVPVVRTPRGRWVVRRYHRGGLVAAPLLRDRYLRVGLARPLREASASHEARRRGIATPQVMGGAVYPSGPIYRADLITEYVPNGTDLARALFRDELTVGERMQILRSVGALVARAAATGIEHVDLNAKNVLLDWSAGGPTPLLLDLDRCRVLPVGVRGDPTPMVERLTRSLRRHAELTRRGIGQGELAMLLEGVGTGATVA